MQAVGSWVEIPAGGGPQPLKGFRASNPMSLHYSGQKMLRSAQVKNALMKRFFSAFSHQETGVGVVCEQPAPH